MQGFFDGVSEEALQGPLHPGGSSESHVAQMISAHHELKGYGAKAPTHHKSSTSHFSNVVAMLQLLSRGSFLVFSFPIQQQAV